MTTNDIIRELHACLYPERYNSAAELERQGFAIDPITGSYQWDSDTLDALADVFSRHKAELLGVIVERSDA